ncbi:hypothetical protein [Streptomyces sp. NPDC007856]
MPEQGQRGGQQQDLGLPGRGEQILGHAPDQPPRQVHHPQQLPGNY